MKYESKTRAKLEILNYIISFSIHKSYGNKIYSTPLSEEQTFIGGLDQVPPIGSLCRLTCCPFTKYYLSWLVETRKGGMGTEYLLESIEDGSLCWWGNVAIDYYHPSTVSKFPQWRWSDSQFEFYDRWKRACKRRDAYMVLPVIPDFEKDGSVTLSTRIRYGGLGDSFAPVSRSFPDWKKVKVKDMLDYYDEAHTEYQQRVKNNRSNNGA